MRSVQGAPFGHCRGLPCSQYTADGARFSKVPLCSRAAVQAVLLLQGCQGGHYRDRLCTQEGSEHAVAAARFGPEVTLLCMSLSLGRILILLILGHDTSWTQQIESCNARQQLPRKPQKTPLLAWLAAPCASQIVCLVSRHIACNISEDAAFLRPGQHAM